MELRQLEVFLAIVETGTFTAAGQRLHVVQSGVSATMHALEHELGAPLFVRTARRAQLTDAGAALVPEARAALTAAAAARTVVAEVRAGVRGPLTVGTMTTSHLVDLPHLLGRFQQNHPHVTISLRTLPGGSRDLEAAVRTGELDVAFVSVPAPTAPGLRLRPLARFPMHLLLPTDHPARAAGAVALGDLAAERWIDSPPGFGNRTLVDAAFAKEALTRTVSIEVADVPSLPGYVAAGLGVAIVPGYVPLDPARVHVRAVRGHDLRWPMSLATASRRPERAVVTAFAAVVAQEVGDGRGSGRPPH
jgi:DNA-binding transcriptional LysR family regulator